jgi:PAS domain S-box-containing protein
MKTRLVRFDILDQNAGKLPPFVAQFLFGLACAAATSVVRLGIDSISPSAGPFALIYPAVLLSTLYGRWRSGLVTYVTVFALAWFYVLPRNSGTLLHPEDVSRMVVNLITALVILIFAELFRAQVRRATNQRDIAFGEMQDLNDNLEFQVAERTREQSQTWLLSPDLLGVLNTDGLIEKSNPAWQALLGWSEAHLSTSKFFEFINPDDLDRTYAAWEMVNEGEPIFRFENRFRDIKGKWHWLSWVVVPEGGKFYGSARDITVEKKAARSLAAAEDALQQSQKLEAIGQLTGGVAHDFNNFLTVIVGSVDLLRRPGLSEEKSKQYIDAIGVTAARAAKLTSQLLAFARRQSLSPEIFECGEALATTGGMLETLVGSRIAVEISLPDRTCFIRADKNQFETAIVNLAINARDAMDGAGTLTISAHPVTIIPPTRGEEAVPGDFIAVKVADTGTGIAADDLTRIFEPFYTTKLSGQGTGLGLSQIIGFAKQSGGEIRVESVIDQGTVFTLYLPRVEAGPNLTKGPQAPSMMIDGEGICVLVVEDNAEVGAFAAQALRELGYDSLCVADADQALAALEEDHGRFDIVFSDVVMPGKSGLELGQVIKDRYPHLPIVLASGYSHVLAQNADHGFVLLHKPYSMEQLADVFSKTLSASAR